MFRHTGSAALTRSRWAGIGAAVAVSLGAGGIGLIAHAGGSTPSSFVSITPCRLFDTRPAPETVGNRNTPLNAGENFVRPVWGTNGNCTIPTTATAISYNLTVPTGINGFLTVYPSDAARPLSSNINPVGGEGVKANSGIVALSAAAGEITIYTLNGPTNALMDITGYFLPGGAGGPGPAGPAGPRGLSAWDVIPSGQTVTGSVVYDTHESTNVNSDAVGVDLPGTAPVALTDATVNFSVSGFPTADDDPVCTGTVTDPTAPAGMVCLYIGATSGVGVIVGNVGYLATRSFTVSFTPNGINDTDETVYATWAYTAP